MTFPWKIEGWLTNGHLSMHQTVECSFTYCQIITSCLFFLSETSFITNPEVSFRNLSEQTSGLFFLFTTTNNEHHKHNNNKKQQKYQNITQNKYM